MATVLRALACTLLAAPSAAFLTVPGVAPTAPHALRPRLAFPAAARPTPSPRTLCRAAADDDRSPEWPLPRGLGAKVATLAATFALGLGVLASPVAAADGAAIGKCLLKSCKVELAKCVTNPGCAANLLCIQTCNGRADESACQIGCGDVFDNPVIGEFNKCAVSQQKCVPQRGNDDAYPLPGAGSMVEAFNTNGFTGRWYISAGLNQIFDTFPCQVHFFESPSPGVVYGKLNWRVVEPDGEFLERHAVQRFVQDPKEPGHLQNYDNEYLHYQDDWYILDSSDKKGEEFVLVYYRGRNDAWDGYGGGFLYTRAAATPDAIKPRVAAALAKGLPERMQLSQWEFTDNACPAAGDAAAKLKLREAYASKELLLGEQKLQQVLTLERNQIGDEVVKEEKELSTEAQRAVSRLEKQIEAYERGLAAEEQKVVKAVEKAAAAEAKELARVEKKAEAALAKEVQEVEREIESLEKSAGLKR